MQNLKRVVLAFAVAVSTQFAIAAEPTISELFLQVDQAVVEIITAQKVVADQGPARMVTADSIGSGFLISTDGRIITAAHVVQLADALSVRFVNGESFKARVLASDPGADVALIQVEAVPAGIVSARLGNSDDVQTGDQVFVIGAPFGIAHSLTVGHISARRAPGQLFGGFEKVELLQTDAAINQGNSGGPMFNMRGEVIGVVSQIMSSTGGSQGLGFVVTSNLAMRVLLDEPTSWTGLGGVLIEGKIARALNLPQSAGIVVESVANGSPASALGLRAGALKAVIADQKLSLGGDIILSVHGIRIGDTNFRERIRERQKALEAQDLFRVSVLRNGEVIELSQVVSVIEDF